MVVTTRALLFAACCAFAVAACTDPNADASKKQSNRAVTNAFTAAMAAAVGWRRILMHVAGLRRAVLVVMVLACCACTANAAGHRRAVR